LCGAVTWSLREVDKNHLQSFEMWCWRTNKMTIWNVSMRNKEV